MGAGPDAGFLCRDDGSVLWEETRVERSADLYFFHGLYLFFGACILSL